MNAEVWTPSDSFPVSADPARPPFHWDRVSGGAHDVTCGWCDDHEVGTMDDGYRFTVEHVCSDG